VVVSAAYAAALFLSLRPRAVKAVPFVLFALYVADTWRINDKFMFLVPAPDRGSTESAVVRFLKVASKDSRVLPLDGSDPMQYASKGIPVMFTSNAVQQMRWQDFLGAFALMSAMPDILNVKYLIMPKAEYEQQKGGMGQKYAPVFEDTQGGTLVLENRSVLPKAWLVPAVALVGDARQRLAILQDPGFDPRTAALVESPPSQAMGERPFAVPQRVSVERYEPERVTVAAEAQANTLLVLGDKYYRGWKATVDGAPAAIVPVNHVLRGVYLTPGTHRVEFIFDPLPFKIGKWLTLGSFALFGVFLVREWRCRRGTACDAG
ncbi:MAG TPA: YfhO family protein, partial [Verrucomicrobiae bacterium]|nr:YfhO family protein [Verrucomicrobiae bacterium]